MVPCAFPGCRRAVAEEVVEGYLMVFDLCPVHDRLRDKLVVADARAMSESLEAMMQTGKRLHEFDEKWMPEAVRRGMDAGVG